MAAPGGRPEDAEVGVGEDVLADAGVAVCGGGVVLGAVPVGEVGLGVLVAETLAYSYAPTSQAGTRAAPLRSRERSTSAFVALRWLTVVPALMSGLPACGRQSRRRSTNRGLPVTGFVCVGTEEHWEKLLKLITTCPTTSLVWTPFEQP